MKNNKPTGGYDRLKAKQAELEAKYAELEKRYNEEVAEHQALETKYTELTESIQNHQSAESRLKKKFDEEAKKLNDNIKFLEGKCDKRTSEVNELLQENKRLSANLNDAEYKIRCRDERIEGQERRLYSYWQHMGWFRRWTWSLVHHED